MNGALRRAAAVAAAALTAALGTLWATGPAGPFDRTDRTDRTDRIGRGEGGATLREFAAPTPQASTPPAADPRRIPTRLTVPALSARLSVEPTGVDGQGFMALPGSPSVAGWYRHGPAPGSQAGATVIAAHVDTRREGPGPLARLDRLRAGDTIEVTTDAGHVHYRVVEVIRQSKAQLDLDALFSRDGPERLHLVTCGGAFDARTRHYEDNVVAVATRVPAR